MIYVLSAALAWSLIGLLFWATTMLWQRYIAVEDLILIPTAIVLGPILIVCVIIDHFCQKVSEIDVKKVILDWRKK